MVNCLCVLLCVFCSSCCSPFDKNDKKQNDFSYIEKYAILPKEIILTDCEDSENDVFEN